MDGHEVLAVFFTPDAIRDAFDGDDRDDGSVHACRARWVDSASEEELRQVGYECIGSDSIWNLFHELIDLAVDERIKKGA